MKKILFIICLFVWHAMQIRAQGSQIERQIANSSPDQFTHINLFSPKQESSKNTQRLNTYLNRFDLLEVDPVALSELAKNENSKLEISLPINHEQLTLQLIKNKVIDGQTLFTAQSGSSQEVVNYTPGAYYSGIIKGRKNTLVALSFYNDDIIGVISDDNGNYVLGKSNTLDAASTEYIVYNDKDLLQKPELLCGADQLSIPVVPHSNAPQVAGACVKVYIEADNKSYTDHASNLVTTINWVTGIFNVTATLYNNESITTVISQIKVWTVADPYVTGTTTANTLPLFSAQMASGFNGDLAHLFSARALGGGIAYIDVLCASNNYKVAVSANLGAAASPSFPTYSWNTMVVTHEMGHNLGSRHTHACVWNGNNTAIDGCSGATEGGCALPGIPAGGGTIMSYCHLQAVGINYNLGFGPQPGNVIRNKVNSATCLVPCCPANVTITGNYGTPLTESSTWIRSIGQTTIVNSASVKLDANPTNGYVELRPVAATDFFLAAPATAAAVFVARALDGCGAGIPLVPTGIEDELAKENATFGDLVLFPNPFSSTITVSFSLKDESRIGFSILNVFGQEISTFDDQVYGSGEHNRQLLVADLPPGIYFCRVTNGRSSVTKKIIKSY